MLKDNTERNGFYRKSNAESHQLNVLLIVEKQAVVVVYKKWNQVHPCQMMTMTNAMNH